MSATAPDAVKAQQRRALRRAKMRATALDGAKAKQCKGPRRARRAGTQSTLRLRDSNPRLRWVFYNGAAAGAGHLAIWSLTGDPMAGAAFMGRMSHSVPQLAAAGLTFGAAVAGWKGAVLVKLHRLPGLVGLAARPVCAIAAAMWGQGTAPLVADAMAAMEPWGSLLAPLAAAGPVAAACWCGLDRRAAELRPPVRWIARIPLATVTLSALLYAPGALL
ncbi:hypothetical protein [Streptomyces sp. NPDC059649]|uniref:hypothetical protein n=1 Tax=Streptomyces sp. NPDC059649 TaxID=3346895 RepID=UPI0036A248DC